MSRQKTLPLGIAVILVTLFLVGCGGPAATAVSEVPVEMSTTDSPTQTPPTATPVPPTNMPESTDTPTPPKPTDTPIPPTPTPIADAYEYTEINSFKISGDELATMALNPDGSMIGYGNYTNIVYLVDASTGEETMTLEGHTEWVSGLAFSPNGNVLASIGDDGVRIWDVKTGEQVGIIEVPEITNLVFNSDGTVLAGGMVGDTIQVMLWDINTLSEKSVMNDVFSNASFSPDGKLLASGGRDELAHIFDVATGKEVMSLSGHKGWVEVTAFSPNGELLASGSDDTTIQLWDVKTGEKLKSLTGHESEVGSLAFSPDGRVLASLGSGVNVTREGGEVSISISSKDETVKFWDIETGEQIGTIEGASFVSFSADWTRAATGSKDGTILLWGSEALAAIVPQVSPADTPTSEPTTDTAPPPPSMPTIKTSLGDLVITEVQFSNRFPPGCDSSSPQCGEAKEGDQILIVWLDRADGGDPLEIGATKFLDLEIYVIADDGTQTDIFSSGFTESRLYVAFVPSASGQNFKLFWPNNSPIELATDTGTAVSPTDTPTSIAKAEIETSVGNLVISDVLFSDRIPPDCDPEAQFGQSVDACFAQAEEGDQFLLLVLERADGGEADEIVSQLSDISEGAYIITDGIEITVALTGNFIGPVVGFTVPTSAQDFKLFWPNNPSIELGK